MSTLPPATSAAADLQRLWYALEPKSWASLALVPAEPGTSALVLALRLAEIAALQRGSPLEVINAEGMDVKKSAELTHELRARPGAQGSRLIVVDSVLWNPSALPVVLAASAALLCVEMGRAHLTSVTKTVEMVGGARFLGSVAASMPDSSVLK